MLTILTLAALHLGSGLYAYSSPEEIFSMPPSTDEQNAWQQISTEPQPAGETAPPTEETGSTTRERLFYKYGEVKTVTPVQEEEIMPAPSENGMPVEVTETSDVLIAEPVGLTPPIEPEPLPLSEEELLVPYQPVPEKAPKPAWRMPAVPMPLLLLGGVVLLGLIAYWIWRIIPRFKTTMSKEAISPPPVDLKTIDPNQMARLKTALGEEEK